MCSCILVLYFAPPSRFNARDCSLSALEISSSDIFVPYLGSMAEQDRDCSMFNGKCTSSAPKLWEHLSMELMWFLLQQKRLISVFAH